MAKALKTSDALISELTELAPIKTWSLIVTLFGDLDGETLTGTQIRALLGRIGIKPEATRVAMHRLKKEDWITSHRHGREAIYRLSRRGVHETHAAYADVYREGARFEGEWRCILTDGDAKIGQPYVVISKDIALAPADVPSDQLDAMVLPLIGHDVPNWLQARLLPQGFIALAAKLADAVEADSLARPTRLPLDAAARRLLVLHHWRRIALRSGAWVLISLMPDGDLARCQRVVSQFLTQTVRIKAEPVPSESDRIG